MHGHNHSEALFDFLTTEENLPCILYLKEPEKTLLASYERFGHFKRQLDKLSATPLVVIGSSVTASKGWFALKLKLSLDPEAES